jgi:predicted small lipoprotein YifL
LLVCACGQRGDLYLPSSDAGKQRTRLPGVVFMPTKTTAQDAHNTTQSAPQTPTPAASAAQAGANTAGTASKP